MVGTQSWLAQLQVATMAMRVWDSDSECMSSVDSSGLKPVLGLSRPCAPRFVDPDGTYARPRPDVDGSVENRKSYMHYQSSEQ